MSEPKPGGKGGERFEELDVLRGLAALSVVLFHYTVRYDQMFHLQREHAFQLVHGYYGVKLFFMISGFVITLTLARTRTLADFVVSRFSRLYPVYWAAASVTFLVMASVAEDAPTLSQYLVNLTMLQRFVRVGDIDGAYWSLAHELGFYVLMAALFATGLLKRIYVVAWFWLAAVVLFHLYPRAVPDPLHLLLAVPYGNLFLAGMMFFELWKHGPDRRALALLAAAFAVSLWKEEALIGVALIASFFALFVLMITGRLRWIRLRAFVFLGAISYSLYLVHQNVGYRVIHALDAWGWPSWVVDGAAISVAIALASLLTFTIERPAQRWLRQRYRAYRQRRTLALGLGRPGQ